jgi:2-C-methyl-D-erythritol 2,4-cyclodiphosphate synthase
VVNIDATVILEKPKVNPHIAAMQIILAKLLAVDVDRVSIKATTHEQVDSFGAGEAIKAYAVCLLSRP